MQAVLPLTRSLSGAVASVSTSRIPHLEYHLLRKVSRARKARRINHDVHSCGQIRQQSSAIAPDFTLGSWSSSEVGDENHGQLSPATELHAARAAPNQRSKSISFDASQIVGDTVGATASNDFVPLGHRADAVISAHLMLDEGNPERLLTWLHPHLAPSPNLSGSAFITEATYDEFEKAFCAIAPEVLIDPFKRFQSSIRGWPNGRDRELYFTRSLVKRFNKFADQLDGILKKRQNSGAVLTLPVCRHALHCAASVGDREWADTIWLKMMPHFGIEPDLQCYNSYMEAHIWNLAYSQDADVGQRNTKRNMQLRSRPFRPRPFLGYRVNPPDTDEEQSWTLKSRILTLFQEVSQRGLATDEQTFTNLILALGKSGDIADVDSILKSVWNIDVNALQNFDEEELESPTFYPESHPLRPSDRLLYAIVHSYAINHSASSAWTILDYVSRNYALPVPEHVWTELCRWTFVLSKPRSQAQRRQGQGAGQIPTKEPENMIKAITDVPHNVRPNADMLKWLAKSYRHSLRLDKSLDTLRTARRHLEGELADLRLMVDAIIAIGRQPSRLIDNGMLSAQFVTVRRDFQRLFLSTMQRYNFLTLEVGRIITEDDWAGSGERPVWSTKTLPLIIDEFNAYVPENFRYKLSTGDVKLQFTQSGQQVTEAEPMKQLLFEALWVWKALRPEDLFQVAKLLQRLPTRIASKLRARASQPAGKGLDMNEIE